MWGGCPGFVVHTEILLGSSVMPGNVIGIRDGDINVVYERGGDRVVYERGGDRMPMTVGGAVEALQGRGRYRCGDSHRGHIRGNVLAQQGDHGCWSHISCEMPDLGLAEVGTRERGTDGGRGHRSST